MQLLIDSKFFENFIFLKFRLRMSNWKQLFTFHQTNRILSGSQTRIWAYNDSLQYSVHRSCEMFSMKINIKENQTDDLQMITKYWTTNSNKRESSRTSRQVSSCRMLGGLQIESRRSNKIQNRTSQKLFCATQEIQLRLANQSHFAFENMKMLRLVYPVIPSRNIDTQSTKILLKYEHIVEREIYHGLWRTTNEEVLRRLGIEGELCRLVKVRKAVYLGHILRNSQYRYAQLIIKGKINEKQGLGKKKLGGLRNIRQ